MKQEPTHETGEDTLPEPHLSPEGEGEALYSRWQARKPPIDHLPPGLGPGGEPLFDVGDRIVVQISASFLDGNPWLETLVGTVKSIDLEKGIVSLLQDGDDPRSRSYRYTSLRSPLYVYRALGNLRGDPFSATFQRALIREEKNRRRALLKAQKAEAERQKALLREEKRRRKAEEKSTRKGKGEGKGTANEGTRVPGGDPPRRGRPVGSKNRPREAILEEKRARAARVQERRARRGKVAGS